MFYVSQSSSDPHAMVDVMCRDFQHDHEMSPRRSVEVRVVHEDERAKNELETAVAATSIPVAIGQPVGTIVGRYRVDREIGSGAMGVVHAAFDLDLERWIALKMLRRSSATHEATARLVREARAMARVVHPNVVAVCEVGTHGDCGFVAMELIQGETLAEWLGTSKRPPATLVDAFLAAGRGIAAAHAAGIVHRDFKPRNVLRAHDGRIVIADFGLAHKVDTAPELPELSGTLSRHVLHAPCSQPKLTATGSLLGTPSYMAPEQWIGGAVTPATDQFAYCVALWEALAGKRPYCGPGLDDLRDQVTRGPLAVDASCIPRRIRGLLLRGLDPDPAQRWPSMDALLEQLVHSQHRPTVALRLTGVARRQSLLSRR
jgi:serine/threonine protein kinase